MAATTTAIASSLASLTTSATSMIASTMTPTTLSPTATPTMDGKNGGHHGDDDGGEDGGRPLLFFVALGFGVVFTNLWIIVGVKYCFRYNQRGRRPPTDPETGEPIDMANMPRPRRKREKKLMSMDEVNERFPLTKYKLWRATREQEGLPAAGGVTAPPSRAGSIKETMLERTSTEREGSTFAEEQARGKDGPTGTSSRQSIDARDFAGRVSTDEKRSHSAQRQPDTSATTNNNPTEQPIPTANTTTDEDEDPDLVRTALPTSTAADLLAGSPGDTCAICIDTLEDEDEVRGLTCGHAFHAGCLDPWLTSRRACCPLCKADYYVPKPRAQRGQGQDVAADGERSELPQPPANVWMGAGLGRPGWGMGGGNRVRYVVNDTRYGFPILVRTRPSQSAHQGQNVQDDGTAQPQPAHQSFGARFTGMFRRGGQQPASDTEAANTDQPSSPEVANIPAQATQGEQRRVPSTTRHQPMEPRSVGSPLPNQGPFSRIFRARPQRFAQQPASTTVTRAPNGDDQQTSPGQLEAGTRS